MWEYKDFFPEMIGSRRTIGSQLVDFLNGQRITNYKIVVAESDYIQIVYWVDVNKQEFKVTPL